MRGIHPVSLYGDHAEIRLAAHRIRDTNGLKCVFADGGGEIGPWVDVPVVGVTAARSRSSSS